MTLSSSKIVLAHQPCPCGKSSDAYTTYDDGHGYCFSGVCDKRYHETLDKPEEREYHSSMESTNETTASYQYMPFRGLSEHALRKYEIRTKVVGDKPTSVCFDYKGFLKIRTLAEKKFYISGPRTDGLFGKTAFPKGSFDTIVITEGELDAPSVFAMVNQPSVSVQSSSQAVKDCRADYEYLNSAKRIILCFDNDIAGQTASKAVAALFDFNKVFKVEMASRKDANDYLQNNDVEAFRKAFANAKKYVPDGVVSSYSEIEDILENDVAKAVVSIPFKELEDKLEGIRLGTSILFSGLEGIGKTEVLRSIEHHVLKNTDYNIGVIHLEESKKACVQNLLSYEVEIPLKRRNVEMPNDELLKHYKALTRRDNRVFIYSHFGSTGPADFLQIIRFLVTVCDCKFIFFDHINILVSGLDVIQDERRTIDYICSRLEMLVEELNFALLMVCHENDDGRPRGSRNISQTAHVHIRLSRDKESANPMERNRLNFMVSKNRPVGPTGPSGYSWYDEGTGCLVDGFKIDSDLTRDILPELPEVK